jgi:uncharacterized protein (TIGR02145 family)
MKRLLFLIVIFCALKANAQNYLISFAGTGATTTVSTVKVENLTKSTSLALNGSDILRLTGTTGVNSIENKQSSGIKIYPNPMTGNSILQIYPPEAGSVVITVFDMTGKLVTQIQSYLENYLQEFRLSGISSGLYLISVKGGTYQYSGKLLCNGKAGGTISIEKISNNQAVDKKTVNMDHKGTQATVDMAYTTGDRLKFTSISGNYSTVITDIPTQDKTITFNFISCNDGDNINYPVVAIGSQVWMAENLKTTKYLNGDLISTTVPATKNIQSESNPKYQWAFDGNESNATVYGRLYTWSAMTDSRGVCPTDWHVSTDPEWTTLMTFLGGSFVAGGKLKEIGTSHWQTPNTGATDDYGFKALPGGYRTASGSFYQAGQYGYWCTSTEASSADLAWDWYMGYNRSDLKKQESTKGGGGMSVRCLKD